MKKVVAFLEQYAEWVALGVACLFLLFVVYSYVVSPNALHVNVGTDSVLPGEVDPTVNKSVGALQGAMDAPGGDIRFPTPQFAEIINKKLGPERDRMSKEILAGGSPVRPPLPGDVEKPVAAGPLAEKFEKLPEVPTPTITDVALGSSLVAAPPPLPGPDDDPATFQPQPVDEATVFDTAIDKSWVTLESKFDTQGLVNAWKAVFFKNGKPLQNVPPQVLITNFLQLEVEREEQVGPDQWSNKVTLKPLPLVYVPPYPKDGDREGQEKYRLWAEQHQLDIIEPAFYRVLKGDPWLLPSMALEREKEMAAAASSEPFDPANPNIPPEKMTPKQKQLVWLYNKSLRDEKAKQDAAARKSRMDTNKAPPSDGGSRSSGGRRIGGYAPLPIQLASGPGVSDDSRPPYGRPGGGRRGYARDGMGRIIPPDGNGRGGYGRTIIPQPAGQPNLNPDGQIQNPALSAPFDPTRLVDPKGNAAEILMWAHDDTTQPGKTYRYRMRVKLKNPFYNTFGLTKTPDMSLQFALESGWSAWKEVVAPRTTEFFFPTYSAKLGGSITKREVNSVTAEVFKHEKGVWTSEKFTVTPGDVIGGFKNGVDYSTGMTLVDLRPSVRDRDMRILVADDEGNISAMDYQAQLKDKVYQSLIEKVKAQSASGVDPNTGQPLGVGSNATPALTNPAGIHER